MTIMYTNQNTIFVANTHRHIHVKISRSRNQTEHYRICNVPLPSTIYCYILFGKFNAQENSRMTRVCLHILVTTFIKMSNARPKWYFHFSVHFFLFYRIYVMEHPNAIYVIFTVFWSVFGGNFTRQSIISFWTVIIGHSLLQTQIPLSNMKCL